MARPTPYRRYRVRSHAQGARPHRKLENGAKAIYNPHYEIQK